MNTVTQSRETQTPDAHDAALLPPVDVIEDSDGISLYADMPGVPKDKLQVRVDGDTLTIEADMVLSVPQGMEVNHAEIQQARYRRSFTLSKELDADKVSAELNQGVLRLRIPKAEHVQPRRISVQVS